ncbi:MAG: indole-3-glycerol phosphate synthase TrpC [Mycoplasmataceae bacterium]|jgi:indole-3-glycerol phosphate synthase|nr:indole-3-glycerol phosphate synthase TrpC [Mycoplasmataceae bacterium]
MILDEIVAKRKVRIAESKKILSLKDLKKQVKQLKINKDFVFRKALQKPGISFICEVKNASPAVGQIGNADFNPVKIAQSYVEAGADCISCITEQDYFKGCNQFFTDIRKNISLPMLRKDFVLDEYQIYEAKLMGANCILLIICTISLKELKKFYKLATKLGMDCLIEANTLEEIDTALKVKSKIIGMNNRDLRDFTVDINRSVLARKKCPSDIVFVSESAIKTRGDVALMEQAKVDAILIGETMMKFADKKAGLKYLKGEK